MNDQYEMLHSIKIGESLALAKNTTNKDLSTENIDITKDEETVKVISRSDNVDESIKRREKKHISTMFHKIIKNINIFMITLFITVLVINFSNISIFIYLNETIKHSLSVNIYNDLGELLHNMLGITNLVICYDMISQSNLTLEVSQNLRNLDYYQERLFDEITESNFCHGTIFYDAVVPTWNSDGEISQSNLFDLIDDYRGIGNVLLGKLAQNESFAVEKQFFTTNGVGFTYEYINDSIKDIVDCEIEKSNDASNFVSILFTCEIIIMIIFFGILLLNILLIKRETDKVWTFVIKTLNSKRNLKSVLINRLDEIHSNNYFEETNSEKVLGHRKIRSKIASKYLIRLLVLIVLSVSYYLFTDFYYFKTSRSLIMNRPKLLLNFITTRSLLWRMEIFKNSLDHDQSVYLTNYKTELYDSINKLKVETLNFRDKSYLNLISDSLKSLTYEETGKNGGITKYGSFAAIDLLIMDTFNMVEMIDNDQE